jgi:hypothetical protein
VIAPASSSFPVPGARLEVDELLAPLLMAVWRLGLPTTASCQNAPDRDIDEKESGEAHINFGSGLAAARFASIVGPRVVVYKPTTAGGPTSVAFPTAHIAMAIERLEAEK